MFDYKLYSNQFSCRLFSEQVSRKIAVIDINKKDTYGIRRFHTTDIKRIERSNRPDMFCKNVFFKNFTKSQEKNCVRVSF